MATYLDAIVAYHRDRALSEKVDVGALRDVAIRSPLPRDFASALREGRDRSGIAVIGEIKRRSPSKGDLAIDLDPTDVALAYEKGGASCLSVLTDEPHFGGSVDDLVLARRAVDLPVLRKDFTVCPADVYRSRTMGADACLLIVAALNDEELAILVALADELSLTPLVEVHDENELERALSVRAHVIGVNQRDLRTFRVDHQRARRVGAAIPNDCLRIAESGITTRDDVQSLVEVGFDAILVGEALVTASDPARALSALITDADHERGKIH